ncbi:glycosyltransferase family 9 protein [Longimicrobium sp.]|uniref:glycosyltransferase family 9 protein n=1 Tax=Longimicrobium sp. TaxID=2029185 RepID=UPI003B3AB4C1
MDGSATPSEEAATPGAGKTLLVHLASGIGNLVFATPLLAALDKLGYTVDLLLHADYPQAADLFRGWSAVSAVHAGRFPRGRAYDRLVPAVPPFYWSRLGAMYRGRRDALARPADALFYRDEQAWYLAFAHALGWPAERHPVYRLPVSPSDAHGITPSTLVIAPGCKTGEMAAKRWPHFAALAERFDDVAVVGTKADLSDAAGRRIHLPGHVRSLVDRLTLRETAEALAAAGVVVANDSGLGHVAGAVGAQTVLLFGPTSERVLGQFPSNVTVLRAGLPCEPCWTTARLRACAGRIDCLRELPVERVEAEVRHRLLGPAPEASASRRSLPIIDIIPASVAVSCETVGPDAPTKDEMMVASTAASASASAAPRIQVREMPLVSCLMPTADRRVFVPHAIELFLRQDYGHRELVIVDDGDDSVADLVPRDPRIRYHRTARQRTIGGKRNLACSLARGELLAHWDDDDWAADDRLTRQVDALRASGADACGLSVVRFFDPRQGRAWEYRWKDAARPWLHGATLLYRRVLWERHPFPELRVGEDTRWVWSLPSGAVHAIEDSGWFAGLVHAHNTSPKQTRGSHWHHLPLTVIQSALGADWAFYAALAAPEPEPEPATV